MSMSSQETRFLENFQPRKILESLFLEAKKADEFEFCCNLLRIKGVQGPGWDPLSESLQFINQLIALINSPLDQTLKARLVLLLYCHTTEIDDIYLIIGNLFRIIKGERYGSAIFRKKDEFGRKIEYPHQKILEIKKLAQSTSFQEVVEIMEFFFEKNIRNAFYHSDYAIYNDNFNITSQKGVLINGVIDPQIPLNWIIPRAKLGIDFSLEVISITNKHILSYRREKIVPARILHNEEVDYVLLTTRPKEGLSGFRSLTHEEKVLNKIPTSAQ